MAPVVLGPHSPSILSGVFGPPCCMGTPFKRSCTTFTSAARFTPLAPTDPVIVFPMPRDDIMGTMP